MKSLLFTPNRIGKLELKNRFIRSATHNNTADKYGFPTSKTKFILDELASNEVGLIITGAATIVKAKNYFYFFSDEYIDPWKKITESIHKKGSKIALQVQHPGRQAKITKGFIEPMGPSAIPINNTAVIPREMSTIEIEEVVEEFAQTCRRAKLADFDAVQLHIAHGYLLSNFISPQANIRKDKYGGSTYNRARIVLDIIKRARELVGFDFPIFIKQNFKDYLDGGLEPKEAIEIAKILTEADINAIEISVGVAVDYTNALQLVKTEKDEAYFKEYADELKKHINIPIILVGGIRSFKIAENIIKTGTADFISMCRPLICEPELIRHWKEGNTLKAKCISCNSCLRQLAKSNGICCIKNK
jgi:2,4-dienoyl-CoA reductase-like NADH-dependent reductase (Old Yellow Enzyme family)